MIRKRKWLVLLVGVVFANPATAQVTNSGGTDEETWVYPKDELLKSGEILACGTETRMFAEFHRRNRTHDYKLNYDLKRYEDVLTQRSADKYLTTEVIYDSQGDPVGCVTKIDSIFDKSVSKGLPTWISNENKEKSGRFRIGRSDGCKGFAYVRPSYQNSLGSEVRKGQSIETSYERLEALRCTVSCICAPGS